MKACLRKIKNSIHDIKQMKSSCSTFTLWLTGLPGSGKSTIAKELLKLLDKNKISYKYLRLDQFRKKIISSPQYTKKERDFVYKKLADYAFELSKNNNVIVDATAYKKKYRDYLRDKVKNFIEIYVKCPVELCIERESKRKQGLVMANIYKKAMKRKNLEKNKTKKEFGNLGQVIGIDVKFEENKNAEIIIESDKINQKDAAEIILKETFKY